ncbi:MAG: cache domain-containing protein [Woeseiaceae bacterium]
MFLKKFTLKIKKNLRFKLLLLVLLPIFIVMPIVLSMAAYWSNNFSYEQLFMKVRTDLSVTHEVFYQQQKNYLAKLERLGESYTFRNSLYAEDYEALKLEVDIMKEQKHFDFLHLLDLKGNWLYESPHSGFTRSKKSVLINHAKTIDGVSGVEIFSQEDLQREKDIDQSLLRLSLIDTLRATPVTHRVEDRGMMLRMIYPIRGETNEVVALLDGGVLLNRNFKFVDQIRDLVYSPGSLIKGSLGTVTIFIDDVRIATNVQDEFGNRALGTRVSEEVRRLVLDEGESWIDSAFVVNDWYISAYEPIYDVGGERVGILYVGFLETPFSQILKNALLILFVFFIFIMLLSSLIAVRGVKSIFHPIEKMTSVARATHAGEELRIGNVDAEDEIGELARQFDSMLDQLQERKLQIIYAAEELEYKVEVRTRELKSKNEDLKNNIDLLNETRKQLVLVEKLASLGELTAGIAHEINNPTAVILGNMDLIISEMGDKLNPVKMESELIIEQVYRIRNIIDSLLQYSRRSESSEHSSKIDINDVVEHIMVLVKHEIKMHHVDVQLNLKATYNVDIHKQELQQILINLFINAIQSCGNKNAQIKIETYDWDEKGVLIKVIDNGSGIEEDKLNNVFDPFYTTKQKGTGLGLSVSFGLVQNYGGTITVENNKTEGACFCIYLLADSSLKGESTG